MSSTRPFLRSQNSPNSASGPAAAPPATQAAIAAAHEREEGNRLASHAGATVVEAGEAPREDGPCCCGCCLFPPSASFCGPSEASFRSALCRNLLEAAPRRCLTQQFMRRMYTSASYRSKGSALVQQEVLSVEALCQLSGYLLGNVLPSLIFPVCSSDTSASCPFLKPGASSNSGHPDRQKHPLYALRGGILGRPSVPQRQSSTLFWALPLLQQMPSAEDLQTARRAAAFAPSLNRLLIRAAFSALLQQLQRATSAVKLATQRQRKRSVEGGGGGQIHFSLVLQHLQTDAGTLDQLLAALLLYDALLSPLQQQQQQIFLLQRLLLLVGREGWQQLRLCRLSARLIFEASADRSRNSQQSKRSMRFSATHPTSDLMGYALFKCVPAAAAAGNILRVLRIAKTLPFLLQAAAYRHIDALRAAAIAACIAAAPVGGASLPLSRLAALLGCSSSSALQFCHQLPQPHQTGPQKYLQTPITAVRLFRGGQMQFVSASSEAAAKADVTQPQVLDLHKFAGAAYSDAWLRLQPAEETVRAAPRNRKQLRELMLQDTLGQQHLPIGFGSA
ncbi:hypothetical protein cyc_01925 [Cyclospora cayetanensis]|uniref:Uncharacterized protein n=1 Tax=Cyclospora cayetanensis TaxID=88456 RepID=A0A1D3D283_9EIME|nr:hypothetical protein cyc_01925 [Cyclospora cayetanensis]